MYGGRIGNSNAILALAPPERTPKNTLGYLVSGDVARRLHPAPPLGERVTSAGVSRAIRQG